MKKICFTIIFTFICVINLFAQGKWKKEYTNDEFTNTISIEMIHYNNDKIIDAIWKDNKLTFFNTFSNEISNNINTNAIKTNNGYIDEYVDLVYVNFSSSIYTTNANIVYPHIYNINTIVFSMVTIDMPIKDMCEGEYISLKYFDENAQDLVIHKLDLTKFVNAYTK